MTVMEKLNIEDIKKIELNMLKELHDFCIKNEIKYFLAYGTLLGAVRHKGFIPWDDDIDLCMLRSDYEKFIRYFNSDKYSICIPGAKSYNYPFVKVYDKSTILNEKTTSRKTIFGIYIDIFPLDYFPKEQKTLKKIAHYRNIIDIKNSKLKKKRSILKSIAVFAAKTVYLVYSIEKACKKMDVICANIPKTDLLSDLVWGFKSDEKFPSELFLETCCLEFENEEFYAMKEYDRYLRRIYGDYMTLPPIEKRISNHTFDAYSNQNI